MKTWFQITNKADKKSSEVYIFDEIGSWGTSAKNFADAWKQIPPDHSVIVRINSGGGSVIDGLGIFHIIAAHKSDTEARIEGVCASIATVIAMACAKVTMSENSFFMIHNPSGAAFGDSEDMRKTADWIDSVTNVIADIYAKSTGKKTEELKAAMAEEKWMTASEAKDWGFVDEITDPLQVAASFDVKKFRHAPQELMALNNKHTTPQMKKLLAKLAELKLINSAELNDDDAALAVAAAFKIHTDQSSSKDAKIAEMQVRIDTYHKNEAEAFVASAVASGKIKDEVDSKAAILSLYMSNPEAAKAMLNAVADRKPAPGKPLNSLPPGDNGDPSDKAAKVRALQARLDAETDPTVRFNLVKEIRSVEKA